MQDNVNEHHDTGGSSGGGGDGGGVGGATIGGLYAGHGPGLSQGPGLGRGSDFVLLAADYSQIELRIMAHYAQDAGLCAAFHNDRHNNEGTNEAASSSSSSSSSSSAAADSSKRHEEGHIRGADNGTSPKHEGRGSSTDEKGRGTEEYDVFKALAARWKKQPYETITKELRAQVGVPIFNHRTHYLSLHTPNYHDIPSSSSSSSSSLTTNHAIVSITIIYSNR